MYRPLLTTCLLRQHTWQTDNDCRDKPEWFHDPDNDKSIRTYRMKEQAHKPGDETCRYAQGKIIPCL
jgi:hypothetical protein